MRYILDAQGKKLGRVASEAASLLRGKNLAGFSRTVMPETMVEIVNASQLAMLEKKATQTEFTRASGYPGGLKKVSLKAFLTRHGVAELLRKTILGMLPRNRLRPRIIKHLIVKN